MPETVQQRIAAYHAPQDRLLRIAGKRLLQEAVGSARLVGLRYDEWGKPVLPDSPGPFSIAHSGELAACAFCSGAGALGIDTEAITPIALPDVADYLSPEEQDALHRSADPAIGFFQFWTRKEAILKATGRGIGIPFHQINTTENPVTVAGQPWFWHPVQIRKDYILHLATGNEREEISVQEVAF